MRPAETYRDHRRLLRDHARVVVQSKKGCKHQAPGEYWAIVERPVSHGYGVEVSSAGVVPFRPPSSCGPKDVELHQIADTFVDSIISGRVEDMQDMLNSHPWLVLTSVKRDGSWMNPRIWSVVQHAVSCVKHTDEPAAPAVKIVHALLDFCVHKQVDLTRLKPKSDTGAQLLHQAAHVGNLHVFRLLVEKDKHGGLFGATYGGWMPVHAACRANCRIGYNTPYFISEIFGLMSLRGNVSQLRSHPRGFARYGNPRLVSELLDGGGWLPRLIGVGGSAASSQALIAAPSSTTLAEVSTPSQTSEHLTYESQLGKTALDASDLQEAEEFVSGCCG